MMAYGVGARVNEALIEFWPGYRTLPAAEALEVASAAATAYRFRLKRTDGLRNIADVYRFVQLWCDKRKQRIKQTKQELANRQEAPE